MVKHLLHHQIDKHKWDELIRNTPDADAFLLSSWLNIVEPSWSALVADDYTAVFPLFIRKKGFWHFFDLPNFVQKISIYGNVTYQRELEIAFELLALEKSLDYICYTTDRYIAQHSTAELKNRRHQILTLSKDVRFPTKVWGRNIRKAEAFGLTTIVPIESALFIKSLKQELKERGNPYSKSDYKLLQELADVSIAEGFGFIEGIVDRAGEILCAQFYLHTKGKMYLVACCSNELARQNSLLHYVLFSIIRNNYGKDLQMRVHFGGSNIPVIADFNKNFGAEDEDFVLVYQNKLPFLLRFFKHA